MDRIMLFITQYVSPVGYAIGWLVTGLGWYVSHHHAIQRESRKEMRTNIDKLINRLHELIKTACDYYTTNESLDQERKSLDIHILIEQCRRQIEIFEKLTNPPKISNKFTELYEAITGGNFESKNRTYAPEDIEKCKRISVLNGKIIECIEDWYNQEYPAKLK